MKLYQIILENPSTPIIIRKGNRKCELVDLITDHLLQADSTGMKYNFNKATNTLEVYYPNNKLKTRLTLIETNILLQEKTYS